MTLNNARPNAGARPKTHASLFLVPLLFALLAATLSIADEQAVLPAMTPADFNDSPRSLQNRLQFPKMKEDLVVTITCGARLDQLGEFANNYCWSTVDKMQGLLKVINRAARDARITPATINGVSRSVWFQYSVEFRKEGDNESISVFPNWGLNREFYGDDYIGPQLYNAVPDSMNCNRNQSFNVAMYIDADASIHDPDVVSGEPTQQCRDQFMSFVKNALFIPAHHDGQPCPARYLDFWFAGPNKWTGRGKRYR
jgi:hypothetical protein